MDATSWTACVRDEVMEDPFLSGKQAISLNGVVEYFVGKPPKERRASFEIIAAFDALSPLAKSLDRTCSTACGVSGDSKPTAAAGRNDQNGKGTAVMASAAECESKLSLDDIERAPERIAELTPEEIAVLAGRLASLQATLMIRALSNPAAQSDRLLTVAEAAHRLGKTDNWMQRNAKALPFAVKMGKSWRFSEAGLAKYLRQRRQG
jgi:hypothetical protein